MNFLLDTDHVSIEQRPTGAGHARLLQQIASHAGDKVFVSIISFHEQTNGAGAHINKAKSAAELLRGYELMRSVLAAYQAINVLDFDAASLTIADSLRRQHRRIGLMDLRIAAIALARGMTLLTRNRSDFGQIANLTIEDWTA